MADVREAEVVEEEIETGPEAGGLIKAPQMGSMDGVLNLAQNIDKIVEAKNKIRAGILKLAQPGDWTLFGEEGKPQKAEIGFAGSQRIGSTLGMSFTNWSSSKERGTDEKGDWFRWEFEADCTWNGITIRVYGRAGSRDKFFGKARGEWKPLHDVDEGNIKIAARRACMKEGVKCQLGLHHMDPDFLKQYGIKLEAAGGHSFSNASAQSQDVQTVTVGIEDVTVKKTEKWTKYTIKDSEGVAYTTFSESFAKVAKDCKEFKTKATISFKVDPKYGPELTGIAATQEKAA